MDNNLDLSQNEFQDLHSSNVGHSTSQDILSQLDFHSSLVSTVQSQTIPDKTQYPISDIHNVTPVKIPILPSAIQTPHSSKFTITTNTQLNSASTPQSQPQTPNSNPNGTVKTTRKYNKTGKYSKKRILQQQQHLQQQQQSIYNVQTTPSKPVVPLPSVSNKPTTTEKLPEQLSHHEYLKARFNEVIASDQHATNQPNYTTPFASLEDAVTRLLPYHIYQYPDSDLSNNDKMSKTEAGAIAIQLVSKKNRLYKRLNDFIENDSKQKCFKAHKVLTEKLIVEEERNVVTLMQSEFHQLRDAHLHWLTGHRSLLVSEMANEDPTMSNSTVLELTNDDQNSEFTLQ
ncbi:hypothetical protein K7432_002820 [Basidiobolus ranarum]|uniref:GLTSCR protein conserved domain-containing protein n=1 Tax=Basidiobolus ranarum TaxID=34480 RepID=A0ABR2X0Z8_9FUNG